MAPRVPVGFFGSNNVCAERNEGNIISKRVVVEVIQIQVLSEQKMNIDLSGKKVLVTGGGSGLGLGMCRGLASSGADLVICGRRVDRLTAAARALEADYRIRCEQQQCDITDPSAINRMFDSIDRVGAINVLINSAAASFVARTESLSANAIDAILRPTLHGAIYCTLEAGKRWIANSKPGLIINILSTSIFTGRAFTVPSAIAKAGLLAMTKSLAVEWGPRKIRVIGIAPGPFKTIGSDRKLDPLGIRYEKTRATIPLGRYGRIEELADLVTFLTSSKADYINGDVITIDGGWHLRTSGADDLFSWTEEDWLRARHA